MKTQKKLILLAVCIVIVVLAICGIVAIVNSHKRAKENDLDIVTEEAKVFYDANVADYIPGNKTLVVFFSWAAHTEKMADAIAMKTGAKSIILDVVVEYPISYDECVNVAQKQKAENARPKLKDLEVNLSDYNTIFVGYPIWLEDMPMPIYTFLEENDFSGKTVIPFTTSKSSGESGTFATIRKKLTSAKVLEGIHFSEEAINNNNFIDEINEWVDGLGLDF